MSNQLADDEESYYEEEEVTITEEEDEEPSPPCNLLHPDLHTHSSVAAVQAEVGATLYWIKSKPAVRLLRLPKGVVEAVVPRAPPPRELLRHHLH